MFSGGETMKKVVDLFEAEVDGSVPWFKYCKQGFLFTPAILHIVKINEDVYY